MTRARVFIDDFYQLVQAQFECWWHEGWSVHDSFSATQRYFKL